MDKLESQFYKEAARKDLLSFCVYTDRFYEIAPHHELIQNALDKLVKGEIQNLIIEMPPRSGKSRIMREFIAKLYGDNPRTDILYTGHSLSLLEGFSRDIINRINSREYQSLYNTKLAQGSAAVKNWNIQGGGEFAVYGVGGGITGKGGNILIVDDPYATRQDAESDTVRRTVSDWYWSTLLSRKQNDKAKQIIIMQRWREDDLVGEILEREGDKWTELKIPALNEEGESFWASRFSSEYLEDLKAKSPLFFMSQYQQDPINDGSGDFTKDYIQYYNILPPNLEIVTFIDPAISQKQEADNTAIVTVGLHKESNNIYILEVKAKRMLPDEIIDEVFNTYLTWKPKRVGIEVIQYQKMLALEIKKQMNIRNVFFVLDEISPSGEKEARIRSILQPRYASRSIYHGQDCNELELELLKFPNGKHDDIIDAETGAINMLSTYNITSKPKIYVPNYNLG